MPSHGPELANYWGILQPAHPCAQCPELVFEKKYPVFYLGRGIHELINHDRDDCYVLDDPRISSLQCTLAWDGADVVHVTDHSRYGTWINSVLIGPGNTAPLRDGDILAFSDPRARADPIKDFRYIFHCPLVEGMYLRTSACARVYDLPAGFLVGQGRFGKVYSARHRESGTMCAVKVMKIPGWKGDTEYQAAKERARKEFNLMSRVLHHNVAAVFEGFIEPDRIYLCMEYCSQGDLERYLRICERLDEDMVKQLSRDIFAGLAFIHRRSVVHCDLKPGNILLDAAYVPKITDFGVATLLADTTSQIGGTALYAPPELLAVMLGARPADRLVLTPAVDSWSMGCVVAELFTGLKLFEDDAGTLNRVVQWQAKWTAAYAAADASDVPFRMPSNEAQDFMRRLLVSAPGQRMRCAEAVDHCFLSDTGRRYNLRERVAKAKS